MTNIHSHCENLAFQVNEILELVQKNSGLRTISSKSNIETSLNKVISPRFEIVFAGAFSAGKSMLINGLLERELLYSAEGHATGTECYIEYAPLDQEKVVLTFLSQKEIKLQAYTIIQNIQQSINNLTDVDIFQSHVNQQLQAECAKIITQEGGVNKSELAKQANALNLLLQGWEANQEKIHPENNAIYSMEQFNFSNLSEAASYARRGKNSAVLKRLNYFCHHSLLEDGNVLVDLPGIDAPIKKDAQLAFSKIEDVNVSAVVCVLKSASAGDLTQAETDLLETIKANSAIRNRVFYVFNRADETWYNDELKNRLNDLIINGFSQSNRVYKTSGLLGFYASQIKYTSIDDRFGLDSIFSDSIKNNGVEETPLFVSEFNNYCANSGKLTSTDFKVSVHSYETRNENYVRILKEWGTPLIDKLIDDSGINKFKSEITRYLREEKRPELYKNLADDLQPICIALKEYYQSEKRELDSQPQEIEAMKQQELSHLNNQLKDIGHDFNNYLDEYINSIIHEKNKEFNQGFQKLQARFINHLDELLQTFSVSDAYSRAVIGHPRNQTAPLIAILVEALYYIANSLEDILVEDLKVLVAQFIDNLIIDVRQQDFYKQLYFFLNNDAGIEKQFSAFEDTLYNGLKAIATAECDRYVRETPQFYSEGTFGSIRI
jgi:replication fork clamp-binding protein CrfC